METVTEKKNGGRREGAGRKKAPHTIESEAAKKKLIEIVNANIEAITLPQVEKAKKGDTSAYTALMDRAHGRPSQQVEVKGDITLRLDV